MGYESASARSLSPSVDEGTWAWAYALAGVVLCVLPAGYFRPDRVLCENWPRLSVGLVFGAVYAAGVGLLSLGWLRFSAQADTTKISRPSIGVLLAVGALHLVALVAPPYLSQDPLFYVAIGRRALGSSDDPIVALLPPAWRSGQSPYGPGFDALCRLIHAAALSIHRQFSTWQVLDLELRLHQVVTSLVVLAASWFCGRTLGARAFVLCALCPLSILEASQTAHNDAWLALLVALSLPLLQKQTPRSLMGAVALFSLGLLCKLSVLLWLPIPLWVALCLWLKERAAGRRGFLVLGVCAGLCVCVGILTLVFTNLATSLGAARALVFPPQLGYEYCTRSIECLPRVLLRHVVGVPSLAYAVGLGFRGASLVLLLIYAERARRQALAGSPLALPGALASFLLFYYLFFHAWAQSWYLLPLLPLLPSLPPWQMRAAKAYLVSATLYYALMLPWNCVTDPVAIALVDLAQGLVTIVPPVVLLLRERRAQRR